MSKLFFDCEFSGLHKNTTLISLGIVADTGYRFYAEFTDYDESQVNDWIRENVISNLKLKEVGTFFTGDMVIVKGTKEDVGENLLEWLRMFNEVQFVSDVCHYDFVLLIDLFGTAFDLPENVSPVCFDINQEIAKHFRITDKVAFDISREKMAGIVDNEDKHNALFDAEVIKKIYHIIGGK